MEEEEEEGTPILPSYGLTESFVYNYNELFS